MNVLASLILIVIGGAALYVSGDLFARNRPASRLGFVLGGILLLLSVMVR